MHQALPPKRLLAIASLALFLTACGKPPTGGAPPTLAVPQVSVLTVKPQAAHLTNELPGRTSPVLVADVRPQVNGIILSRNFTEGGMVKKGELLYQIDPATYKATLDSAQATLDRAQATLTSAKLKADRYKDLVAIKAVSQQDYDDAQAALKQAVADVESAKASVQTAKINLDYTRVTAPISGRIGRSSVTPGALVTANQTTAMATIQQLDPIYVDLTQSSTSLLNLKQLLAEGKLKSAGENSAKTDLILDNGRQYPGVGTLKFAEVTVESTTGAVTVRAEFPNPKGDLLPGMYVRARVQEGVAEDAILIPQRAVVRDNHGDPTAYVVTPDNKIELRALEVGRTIGSDWLISSGLKAGDRVVVDGIQKIRPGVTVEVLPDTASAAASAPAAADAASASASAAAN
jgi:membrane fusion protein, multidrug efflux system